MDHSEIKYDLAKKALKTYATVKQDVFENSFKAFKGLKNVCIEVVRELATYMNPLDPRVKVLFSEKSTNEFWAQFGGDLLIFSLHTNIFTFEKTHTIYQSPYIVEDPTRAYFTQIEIYNFLNDSAKYDRTNDIGELIARIFVNKENNFIIEGMGSLGILFNDLAVQKFETKNIEAIIERVIVSAIEYELWVPPFQDTRYIPFGAILAKNGGLPHPTAKRLGFAIKNESSDEEMN